MTTPADSSTTPAGGGDSFVATGRETSGQPVAWGSPQDHAACNEAIAAAGRNGAREALLSLAAELDGKARDWHQKASHNATAPDAGGTAAAIARAYEGAARLARQRAQDSPGAVFGAELDRVEAAARAGERRRLAAELERRATALDAEQPTSTYAYVAAVVYREAAQVVRESTDGGSATHFSAGAAMTDVPEGLCRCCWLNAGERTPAEPGSGYCGECEECCQS